MNNHPPFDLYPGERQVLESRPWISTADFAERHFRLATGPYKGQTYRHDRNPIARWIMDLWDRPMLRTLFIVGPSQVSGKTTLAYCCMASELYRDPCSVAVGMPDKDTRNRIFEEKIGPHFKQTRPLREMLSEDAQAVQRGLILTKFGAVYGMHAGSDASASSISPRVVLVDEEDAYLDPQAAARMVERNMSYDDEAKTLRYSKIRGNERSSCIWKAIREEAQVIYQVRACCPNCGGFQIMDLKRIKVPGKMRDPKQIKQQKAAWYECVHCGMKWNDHYRNLAVARGDLWAEHDLTDATAVAVLMPSWVFAGMSLSTVMADWFTAARKGTPSAMEWFDNSHASKPYQVVTIKTPEDQVKAMIRHDRPAREVPAGAVALTMGVDSQKASWFFTVRAWAKSGESWLVDYGELASKADVYAQLDAVYPVAGRNDVVMPIWRSAVDFGGTRDESRTEGWSRSEEVKLMVLEADRDDFHAVKGASRRQDSVVRRSETGVHRDVPREYRENITIYTLDTHDLKDLIFLVRMHPDSIQPMWLHREVGDDYLRQLASEERDMDRNGNPVWVQRKAANHYLDCEVYAAACAHPDWTPALQLLPEPNYRKVVASSPPRSSRSGGYGASGGGLVTNPFFGR
ncbi:phage terminase large subunit family protein [Pseudodesulfovibrio thermohalotolerans]|uniref:terminase gpA endonuclease subunit n=1 Tax=Pseudodesulfovibrio thermohalotolerans TaxID=2880651 RepID=UPI0024427DC2|nr:terminase gpA endonuclease subunit [Pseudodesulfovibrio thermohalotolerans]WFS63443.1 phage terminase large subunit family protein [Pseudodesulfovibrio thermohalotolerans]